jgi:hypothetical protein
LASHPKREQILMYRDRRLLPAELVEVDGHLAACEVCRIELAELASPPLPAVSAILEALDEHVTYEQMDAWVEGSMDSDERELVMSHIGLCEFCAQQLKAYEGYAPAMSAAIPPPAQPSTSLGDRIRAFFRTPQFAMVATGLVVVAILSPLAIRKAPAPGTATLPATLRPEAIRDLPETRDKGLKYPVSEVVEERQPILEWMASNGESTVYLYDAAHREVARSQAIADTHWLVPVLLDRGAVFNWEVRTAVETRKAMFRVLSGSGEKELADARAANVGLKSIGQLEQTMGLLSLAEHDFATLVRQNPGSKEDANLLDLVKRIQGR